MYAEHGWSILNDLNIVNCNALSDEGTSLGGCLCASSQDLTVSGSLIGCTATATLGTANGGGILAIHSTAMSIYDLLVDSCVVRGGGPSQVNTMGGGLIQDGNSTIERSQIVRCTAHAFSSTASAGGLSNAGGIVMLTNVTVAHCVVKGSNWEAHGGGLSQLAGILTMFGGQILNNTVLASYGYAFGGALIQQGGIATFHDVQVVGCMAQTSEGRSFGGGLVVMAQFTMTGGFIANCTSASTSGISYGGGVHAYQSCDVVLQNMEVVGCVAMQGGGLVLGSCEARCASEPQQL